MSLPVNLQADLDQDSAAIRDLLDRHPALAEAVAERTELGKLLAEFGMAVAANIFAAGASKHAMDMRALAWIAYLEGTE